MWCLPDTNLGMPLGTKVMTYGDAYARKPAFSPHILPLLNPECIENGSHLPGAHPAT